MKRIRNRYLFVIDIILCILAYVLTIGIVFPVSAIGLYFVPGIKLIAVTTAIYAMMLSVFGIYHIDWNYAGANEYLRLILGVVIAAIGSFSSGLFINTDIIFPKINIAANAFVITMICGLRFAVRLIYRTHMVKNKPKGPKTLIIGAGRLAVVLLRDIADNEHLNYDVVGLIDDDPNKQKTRIYNSSVIGTRNDIVSICREKKVEQIIFAIHSLTPIQKTELLDICSKTGVKVSIIPGVEAALTGKLQLGKMRDIEIEDLLERAPITLDNKLIKNEICGKTVMVTGGGGSIGSELCRQIVKFKPERLVILDIYENTTYELQNELEENYPNQKLDVLIASVRDKQRLDSIFEKYKPDIVFHAAAHKHVPLMEFSPCEAIKNNIFGTCNTARAAIEYGVKRFVLISTDKAVNPTNVMGASKRMCEMIIQTMQNCGKTEFAAVRFGNVLGSNGSVIPRFRKQISAGGPVTVTHPEITRFFMTIPEAAQLVLQAAAYAKGGEIFVLDMGKPVKIYDLARKMIYLSGLKPDEDIEIKFTGLRAGEKLYEELLMNEEGLKKTAHSKIFVGSPIDIDFNKLNEKLEKLRNAVPQDEDTIKQIISEVVPTYRCPVKKQTLTVETEKEMLSVV